MEGGSSEKVRIYVGGLGEKVTADDLKKMLSPALGEVQAVDLIRTKGRSFAYMELLPSSPASLSKLFCTYNGCVWKGGKLRLEKAKEHYLARMQREWAEASLPVSAMSDDDKAHPAVAASSRPKLPANQLGPTHDNLRIFFPKLGKMKSIPFSGTGKHKYSFRRIQFPSPPEYFCDCDEHSGPPLIPRKEQNLVSEGQGAGIDEREIHIMNSVIGKLFARENIVDIPNTEPQSKLEAPTSSDIIDPQVEDEPDSVVDEDDDDDDLVINLAGRGSQIDLVNEVLKLKERPAFEDKPTPYDVLKQGTDTPYCKKQRSAASGDKDANVLNSSVFTDEKAGSGGKQSVPAPLSSRGSSWRNLMCDGDNNSFSISDILHPAASSKEEESNSDKLVMDEKVLESSNEMGTCQEPASPERFTEAKSSEPQPTSNKTGRGSAWLHECSWTQLIGGISSGFRLGEILPSAGSEKQDQMEFSSGNSMSEQVEEGKVGLDKDSIIEIRNEQDTTRNSRGVGLPGFDGNKESKMVKSCTEDVAIGETCLFMRTEASVKEWASMKASLSGSRKRKNQS